MEGAYLQYCLLGRSIVGCPHEEVPLGPVWSREPVWTVGVRQPGWGTGRPAAEYISAQASWRRCSALPAAHRSLAWVSFSTWSRWWAPLLAGGCRWVLMHPWLCFVLFLSSRNSTVSLLINSFSVGSLLVSISRFRMERWPRRLNCVCVCHLTSLRAARAANTFVALTACLAVFSVLSVYWRVGFSHGPGRSGLFSSASYRWRSRGTVTWVACPVSPVGGRTGFWTLAVWLCDHWITDVGCHALCSPTLCLFFTHKFQCDVFLILIDWSR